MIKNLPAHSYKHNTKLGGIRIKKIMYLTFLFVWLSTLFSTHTFFIKTHTLAHYLQIGSVSSQSRLDREQKFAPFLLYSWGCKTRFIPMDSCGI